MSCFHADYLKIIHLNCSTITVLRQLEASAIIETSSRRPSATRPSFKMLFLPSGLLDCNIDVGLSGGRRRPGTVMTLLYDRWFADWLIGPLAADATSKRCCCCCSCWLPAPAVRHPSATPSSPACLPCLTAGPSPPRGPSTSPPPSSPCTSSSRESWTRCSPPPPAEAYPWSSRPLTLLSPCPCLQRALHLLLSSSPLPLPPMLLSFVHLALPLPRSSQCPTACGLTTRLLTPTDSCPLGTPAAPLPESPPAAPTASTCTPR